MALTLVETMKTASDPLRAGIIETVFTEVPEFQYIPWRDVPGLALSYVSEQELPNIQFRKLNAAFAESTGVVQRNVETLKPFGGDSDCDKVLVDAYGAAERATYDGMYAKAAGIKYMQFLYYGNSPASRAGVAYDDIDGFDGLMNRIADPAQTVDALGTGGTDGSSVFAMRFGDGYVQGLQTGGGLDSRDLGELQTEPSYRTRVDWTVGLAIFHGRAVAYVKDLRAAAQNLTWQMMDQLADLITGNATFYGMSTRSRRQLKASAITVGVALSIILTKLGNPVESWGGVPIFASDIIIDTETNS